MPALLLLVALHTSPLAPFIPLAPRAHGGSPGALDTGDDAAPAEDARTDVHPNRDGLTDTGIGHGCRCSALALRHRPAPLVVPAIVMAMLALLDRRSVGRRGSVG
jgi:hypothetical protein